MALGYYNQTLINVALIAILAGLILPTLQYVVVQVQHTKEKAEQEKKAAELKESLELIDSAETIESVEPVETASELPDKQTTDKDKLSESENKSDQLENYVKNNNSETPLKTDNTNDVISVEPDKYTFDNSDFSSLRIVHNICDDITYPQE